MAPGPGDAANKLGRALGAGGLTARLAAAAATLKAEYDAGKRGDDTPSAPLWAPPRQQLDTFLGLLGGVRRPRGGAAADPGIDQPSAADAETETQTQTETETETDEALAADAAEVSGLLERVDWTAVRDSAAARSADATRAVRSMAAQVDWARVQPVAAQASSLLIAAVASGQVPVVGRTGTLVARAMLDEGGLGERVGRQLVQQAAVRPELRTVIGVVDSIAAQRPPAAT